MTDRAGRDTIAAVATPAGTGGVGVVRVSGPLAPAIAESVLRALPPPRLAIYRLFLGADGAAIDAGLALYFPAPASFTGDDVLELQGHGGPVVLDLLLARTLELGARLARPGEFTERAFLSGKLDLAQAEAVADLIDAGSAAAARSAMRTLQGELSRRVNAVAEELTRLRIVVEAAIDFPDEETDLLGDADLLRNLDAVGGRLSGLIASAGQGRLLRDGARVVIAGPPNAGKSSLLNALAGHDAAIVTAIPGTTRDVLREHVQIDGLPLHIVDTAGIHNTADPVEQEGIRRARGEIERADCILWLHDDTLPLGDEVATARRLAPAVPLILVRNKIDLSGRSPGLADVDGWVEVSLSATTFAGLELLRARLKALVGYAGEGDFTARRRHLDALQRTQSLLETARAALAGGRGAELVAEDLRLAHRALGEITGEVTSDDLLGRIFASFCIGK
jgi:tRNA modification GTPase